MSIASAFAPRWLSERLLSECVPCEPLRVQGEIIRACLFDVAPSLGLTIPAGLEVHTVDRSPDGPPHHRGETQYEERIHRIRVYLDVGDIMPGRLAEVVLHEAQHVSDFAESRGFDRTEWETRAIDFSRRAVLRLIEVHPFLLPGMRSRW
jgi:hypothetical protein